MNTPFKQRLARHERMIGTLLTLPSPEIAEICVEAGFDWLFIDMEHGTLDVSGVQRMTQAVAGRCACIVRIPVNEPVWFKKILDIGVEGVIVPHVNTLDEARRAVQASKYPPAGERSIGISRAQRYGVIFQDYLDHANERITLIVQAEHIDAARNIEQIVAVPGIDAVLVGPYDLSASMNKPGQVDDPEVRNAIAHVKQACAAQGLPISIFAGNIDAAQRAWQDGFHFVAVSTDVATYLNAAIQLLKTLR